MMRYLSLAFVSASFLCLGCAKAENANGQPPGNDAPVLIAQAAGLQNLNAAHAPTPVSRKIIYTADVALVTESLDGFQTKMAASLERFQGFVAAQQLTGRTGSRRVGTWTVRLPVNQFSKFLDELKTWGELESESIKSDDVTEEFVDVESRLKNKRIEEERLLNILKDQTDNLEQVLAVERALHEVREQVERMEGRTRYLANRIELTTITLTVREVQDYVPPQPATFGTQISRTFQESLHALVDAGKFFILALVAVSPWLVPLALAGFPVGWLCRRAQQRNRVSR